MKLTTVNTKDIVETSTSICSTSASRLYPFYILCRTTFKSKIGDGYFYHKPATSPIHNVIGRYDHLFATLDHQVHPDRFEFTVQDELHQFYVCKHFIMDRFSNPMLCMTFKDLSLIKKDHEAAEEFLDYTPFKLLISTVFLTDPIYKNVWKKIEKEYVMPCYLKGISVEFTTSQEMDKVLFSTPLKLEFNTIQKMEDFLKIEVNALMDTLFTGVEEETEDVVEVSAVDNEAELDNILDEFDGVVASSEGDPEFTTHTHDAEENYTLTSNTGTSIVFPDGTALSGDGSTNWITQDSIQNRYVMGVDPYQSVVVSSVEEPVYDPMNPIVSNWVTGTDNQSAEEVVVESVTFDDPEDDLPF